MARIKVHKHHVQDRVTLEIMNAEDLTFPDESFDVVCGMGILHHLALKAAMPEIRRVLKPNGRAVFLEPMGHNPAIQLFRTLTPKLRTPDEHPLKARDLKSMASLFRNLDARFFYLASLMAVPFRKTPVFESVRSALHRVDDWILSWPVVKNLAWVVVFTLEK